MEMKPGEAKVGEIPIAVAQAVPVASMIPAGLQLLAEADGFYIRQKAQWLEEFTGFEKKNKYQVRRAHGHVASLRSFGYQRPCHPPLFTLRYSRTSFCVYAVFLLFTSHHR